MLGHKKRSMKHDRLRALTSKKEKCVVMQKREIPLFLNLSFGTPINLKISRNIIDILNMKKI